MWCGATAPRQAWACPGRVNGKRNYTCARRRWSGVKCLAGCSVSTALRWSDSRRGSALGEALGVLGHVVGQIAGIQGAVDRFVANVLYIRKSSLVWC